MCLSIGAAPQSHAQESQNGSKAPPANDEHALPPVSVTAPKPKPRPRTTPSDAPRSAPTRNNTPNAATNPTAAPATQPVGLGITQDTRTGTVGIYSDSTAVATKTNTALVNIPQSLNVITRDFIKDQTFQNFTDMTRYVPGVAVHQGEGNRDELVIRGVDSSANFFVNGFRDDVQIFRDLYNTQSIEVLKGPSALTFGRGAGGGLVNRTLKEADGTPIYEATMQTGSFADRRFTVDLGQAANQNVAVRLNMMYEGADNFPRDFSHLERYGFNPTVTFTPNDTTRVTLSYEYFHDDRTADRGNPSLAVVDSSGNVVKATRFNPTTPFAPGGDMSQFFGSPDLNKAITTVNSVMGMIEHDFQNGLTVKNATRYADYDKFYQNVYAANGPLAGEVDPLTGQFNRAAYQHTTNRENIFNQTDFTYKAATGPLFHTLGFGTEFAHQQGIDVRNTGIFANGTNTELDNVFAPTFFGPVTFVHHDGITNLNDGVTTPDSNSRYRADIQSAYVRDTIELTRWLQVIGGVRFDRFDLNALDMNTNTDHGRTDNLISPQAAVILKPRDNLSIYGTYMVSYLPASGDQFSALTNGTVILDPQKFENFEVGVKWNVLPRLLYTAAAYDLERSNVPLADPNNAGFFILSGHNRVRGFETALTGYVTEQWQSSLGYAYTDARVTSDTSTTILAGNRVQLVPFNQVSLWNKYQINETWGVGLGIIYFSDSFATSDDSVKLPGFVRVDTAVYLKINETWRAQFNIENLFNKGYWASADSDTAITPGLPRTFRIKATAKF